MNLLAGIGVALGFLVGIPAHQYAHHRLATMFGDHTPRMMRRLTLSPKAHADPLGSYILPSIWVLAAIFSGFVAPPFGWGKKASVSPHAMRDPKRHAIIVRLAGPFATGVLAVLAGAILRNSGSASVQDLAGGFALVNVAMTVFELLPMPGRDAGHILKRFLSPSAAAKMEDLEQYEVLFLIVLYIFLAGIAIGIFRAGCEALLRTPC